MSRSDQWIGLTDDAKRYVDGLTSTVETPPRIVEPAFNLYPYTLDCWTKIVDGHSIWAREVLQSTPWYSGPMYFTCLELDYNNGFKIRCFEWVNNPETEGEFDPAKGHFWV